MKYFFAPYKPSEIIENHLNMGSTAPNGDRLYLNSRYFTLNNKPVIYSMGEYHFSRAEKEDWYNELCKMKAGGLDVVATYLFWIHHEEIEGEIDFSGDLDIRRFVLDAQRAGLKLFLRIGPWAHGECRNGGFPDWLLKKGIPLRCNDKEYLKYVRKWYESIFEQVKGLFYKDGGNIIGVQLENELTDDAEHLLTLKRMAVEIGFDAPYYTVTGWNSHYGAKIPADEVIPMFGGYADAPWASGTDETPLNHHYAFNATRNDSAVGVDIISAPSPDGWLLPYERYPYAACEIGAGLHSTHHRRLIFRPMDAYAMSLVTLGSGCNLMGYYMYHGGQNPIGRLSTFNESRSTGYPNDYPILDYDYQTALGQYGQAREQYGMLNLLHLFLQDFGGILAPMEYVPAETKINQFDLKSLRYALRYDGRRGFVFINHYQRKAKLYDISDVQIVIDEGLSFPKFDVRGDICCIFPFNIMLGSNRLKLATAQLICEHEGTYFFAAIDEIEPIYRFEDKEIHLSADRDNVIAYNDIKIVTLPFEEACRLRRLDGEIYLGEDRDIYTKDGEIHCIQPGSYAYYKWNGEAFERFEKTIDFTPAALTMTDCAPAFDLPYPEDLTIGGARPIHWKRLSVSGSQGFVSIDTICDAAQIYADHKLVADWYWNGQPREIPAKMIYQKEAYLVYSEQKNDFWLDRKI